MKKRVLIVTGAVLAVILFGAAVLVTSFNNMLLPVDSGASNRLIELEIPPGATTDKIASILEDAGVIHNAAVFRLYTRWHSLDTGFIAGTYHLSPAMDLQEIIDRISRGEVHRDTVWFTIPEGFTAEQIADRLANRGLADRERFLELAANPPESFYERFPFIGEIDYGWVTGLTGEGWRRTHPPVLLEGYLFPDTYEITAGVTEEDIIAMMLNRMQTVYDGEYDRELVSNSRVLEMSMQQVLTLASIVEKEAGVPGDFAPIAGVFHNRLAVNHALESCATVNFFLDIDIEVLLTRHRDVPSPYNTYLNAGLPPGPIAAPGRAAIRAVLYPAETDYKYFCSKGDGSGESFFARTYAEHLRNVAIMKENMRNK